MAFLSPSKDKLARTLILASTLPVALVFGLVPASWDLLDLRQLGGAILGALLGGPIWLLDRATGSAFATRSEGFLVFPSLTQIGFALTCDALLFYVLACTWVGWRRRRVAGRGAG